MAIVSTNPLVDGLSGMLGRTLVFKNYFGRTIVASKPRPPKTQSESQKANRNKFREATHWAKHILKDPERKAYYQKKAKQLNLPNAYTAAITDFMRKPVVNSVTIKDQTTYIVSKKDFPISQVKVKSESNIAIIPIRLSTQEWTFETSIGEPIEIIITGANGKSEMMIPIPWSVSTQTNK